MKRFLICLLLLLAPLRAEVSEEKLQSIYPTIDQYIEKGMKDWDVKAVAFGVVHHDRLVYFKGFGTRSPHDPIPPDVNTTFAIGSTTKAYAAATLAQVIDDGKLKWDTRVIDVLPSFRMYDPWVTREFRVADLLAQHTGMAPYVVTSMGCLGYSEDDLIDSMRYLEPVTSFRTTFAYVNVPHMVAGRMVARLSGEPNWEAFLQKRLLTPLGMTRTTWTPEAFNREPNRAVGWVTLDFRSVPRPAGSFPYSFGPAGALNSCVNDVSHWVRLQLADGKFEGKQLVSKANLDVTKTPQTTMSLTVAYCMGWVKLWKPHPITWHNGGTPGHRTFVGLMPDEDLGVIVLTNNGASDLSDAVGLRFFDLATDMGNEDYSALSLARAQQANAEVKAALQPPAGAAPPRPWSEYAGTYRSDFLGDILITPTGGLKLLRTGAEGVLKPYDGDVMTAYGTTPWVLDNGCDLLGRWTFARDNMGRYASLRCELGWEGSGCVSIARRI